MALWFLMVAAVPLVAAIVIVYHQRVEVIKAEAFTKLSALRDLKAREIDSWIDERIGDTRTLANNPDIRRFVSDLIGNEGERDRLLTAGHGIAVLLDEVLKNYDDYDELSIVSLDGKVILSTNPLSVHGDYAKQRLFTEPVRTQKLYISDILVHHRHHRPTLVFSMPIPDRNGLPGAVLISHVDLNRSLYEVLLARAGFGHTGETLIVSRDGVALSELRWHENAPLRLKITAAPAVHAAAGETGIIEAKDYRNVDVLAAYTHLTRMGWGLVAKQDQSECYGTIRQTVRDLGVLLGMALIAVVIVAMIVSGSIARPVSKMASVAVRIASGQLDARQRHSSRDELGALASSFNTLADSLVSRLDLQTKSGAVMDALIQPEGVAQFGEALISVLIDVTAADIGAFYTVDPTDTAAVPAAAIGTNYARLSSFDLATRDGIVGQSVKQGRVTVTRMPVTDDGFCLDVGFGAVSPREIMSIPFVVRGDAVALLLLGTLSGFSEMDRELVEGVSASMTSAYANIKAGESTRQLARALEEKNVDLIDQAETMRRQSDELQQRTVELQLQREEVEEANRLKGEFLSNMSHELRTPLNAILAIPEALLAKENTGFSPQEREYLRVVERNGRALLRLINDILDLSKIESGRMDLVLAPVALSVFVRGNLEALRPMAEKKGLALHSEVRDDLPRIVTDELKLRQVLTNVVGNAIKFTDTGGIVVDATREQGGIRISVTDTGVGIDDAHRSVIFEAFRQIDGSVSRAFDGTGLGLAISKKLMTMLGGEISVESELGKGSRFDIFVPIAAPTREEPVKQEARKPIIDMEAPLQVILDGRVDGPPDKDVGGSSGEARS